MKTRFTSIFPRAAMTLLLMLLTTATAWAEDITTNITYAGLTASDVTFTLSGNGKIFQLNNDEGKIF